MYLQKPHIEMNFFLNDYFNYTEMYFFINGWI